MRAPETQPIPSNARDFHILWLMKEGHTPNEIASMLGSTTRGVRTIVQHWNQAGEQGIQDQRLTLPGAPACSQLRNRRNWIKPSISHLLMGACGAVQKWLPGCKSVSDDQWTLAGAGITCSV
jgi:hypothetical protein